MYHGIFRMNAKSYNNAEIHENKLTPLFNFRILTLFQVGTVSITQT